MARRAPLPLGRVDLSRPCGTRRSLTQADQGGGPRAPSGLSRNPSSPTSCALSSYTTSRDLTASDTSYASRTSYLSTYLDGMDVMDDLDVAADVATGANAAGERGRVPDAAERLLSGPRPTAPRVAPWACRCARRGATAACLDNGSTGIARSRRRPDRRSP